jgi:hypothetical protein
MAARLPFGSSFDGIPSKHRPVNLFARLGRLPRVSGAVPEQVIGLSNWQTPWSMSPSSEEGSACSDNCIALSVNYLP